MFLVGNVKTGEYMPKTSECIEKMTKAIVERNEVECSFGIGKRIYLANNVRVKLSKTAEC